MKYFTLILIILYSTCSAVVLAAEPPPGCGVDGQVTLQVLGSGGPIADDARASTSYLLWVNGRSRFMVDAGGGSFLRFGEAGARFEDLDHIAISHLHTDHSTDLVALLKSGYFSNRNRDLSVSGPAGGGAYPGIQKYFEKLLDADTGPYAYLAGYLDGSGGLVRLTPLEVDPGSRRPGQGHRSCCAWRPAWRGSRTGISDQGRSKEHRIFR